MNKLVTTTAILLASSAAIAGPDVSRMHSKHDPSGPYVSAGFSDASATGRVTFSPGQYPNGDITIAGIPDGFSESVKLGDNGFNLGAGYQLNEYAATEIRYTDVGDGDAFSLLAKLSTDITNDFSFYGLIGATEIEIDHAYSEYVRFEDTSFSYGFGVTYNAGNGYSASLEYLEAYDESITANAPGLGKGTVGADAQIYSLSFTKRF